jgi:hypothetical protein
MAGSCLLNRVCLLCTGGAADATNAAIATLRPMLAACFAVVLVALDALVAQIADHVERAVL